MQPVIVEGVPRSGTRFLCNFIKTQYNIKIYRIQKEILQYYKLISYSNTTNINDFEKIIYHMIQGYNFKNHVGSVDIKNIDFEKSDYSFAYVISTILNKQAQNKGYNGWGLKFDNPIGTDTCLELFPQAKFIHLIRDGRDVHLSACNCINEGYHNVLFNSKFWKTLIEDRRNIAKNIDSNNYIEMKYEQLLNDPYYIFEKLGDFLGIKHRKYFDIKIKNQNYYKWKQNMSLKDLKIYELIAGRLLDELGYPVNNVASGNITIALQYYYFFIEKYRFYKVILEKTFNKKERPQVINKLKYKIQKHMLKIKFKS